MNTIARVRRAFCVYGWSVKKIRQLEETDFSYEHRCPPLPRIGP